LKTLLALLIFCASAFAQASAPITFAGEIGSTFTVSAQAFAPMIAYIESVQASGVPATTLAANITSASTTFTLASAAGVLPGMGLALGTCPGSGCSVALVKAAGCTSNVCTVSYSTLGTTAASFASGSRVTVLAWGNGSSFACGYPMVQVQGIVASGASTSAAPPNAALASTTVATQNAAIAAAQATIGATIAAGGTCVPLQ
jgi:hypothetical protein